MRNINVTADTACVNGSNTVKLELLTFAKTKSPLDWTIDVACIPLVGIAIVFAMSFAVVFTSGVTIPDGSVIQHNEFAIIAPLVISSISLLALPLPHPVTRMAVGAAVGAAVAAAVAAVGAAVAAAVAAGSVRLPPAVSAVGVAVGVTVGEAVGSVRLSVAVSPLSPAPPVTAVSRLPPPVAAVGAAVGAVGVAVGAVGVAVGVAVGAVGAAVGVTVGAVGVPVGAAVGAAVGGGTHITAGVPNCRKL
jgi:hypothetical protein